MKILYILQKETIGVINIVVINIYKIEKLYT